MRKPTLSSPDQVRPGEESTDIVHGCFSRIFPGKEVKQQ